MNVQALQTVYRDGNLHISLDGPFTSEMALQLSNTIATDYCGEGIIFVHTGRITAISPQSRTTFEKMTEILDLPRKKIYLTGQNGLKIGPNKVRVIVYDPLDKGCCGNCHDGEHSTDT
ncbi:hypothetical protein JWJ90_00895 [Desulfobulbus rhabdoformis]|jgi:hypothetical protein|uniref:hypothetical protein n=1 Tax=Desulfobulbus rhabdoformis TaxID=34032 RepID=UPI0019654560|nr:hypothetical protein [Desulfobulbus rhabdoformis]MBM9612837.1 hypothetical protein [Desulfobulbus rhabdoformis]